MPITKYSQFDEQVHILEAVKHATSRRFLDIGSWDPITFSNTRALFELGWSGLMIDPAPGPMIELLRCCTKCAVGVDQREHERYGERKQRECAKCGAVRYGFEDRLTLIQAAVGLEPGFLQIAVTDDALSTSDDASYGKWAEVGGFYGYLLCPTITLEQITTQFGGFDFINFDVEGQSAELFLRMLKIGLQPTCVCVEEDNRLKELCSAATHLHYNLIYSNGTNAVFVRK